MYCTGRCFSSLVSRYEGSCSPVFLIHFVDCIWWCAVTDSVLMPLRVQREWYSVTLKGGSWSGRASQYQLGASYRVACAPAIALLLMHSFILFPRNQLQLTFSIHSPALSRRLLKQYFNGFRPHFSYSLKNN